MSASLSLCEVLLAKCADVGHAKASQNRPEFTMYGQYIHPFEKIFIHLNTFSFSLHQTYLRNNAEVITVTRSGIEWLEHPSVPPHGSAICHPPLVHILQRNDVHVTEALPCHGIQGSEDP